MYCFKCGAEIPDESEFCFKCGSQMPSNIQVLDKNDINAIKDINIEYNGSGYEIRLNNDAIYIKHRVLFALHEQVTIPYKDVAKIIATKCACYIIYNSANGYKRTSCCVYDSNIMTQIVNILNTCADNNNYSVPDDVINSVYNLIAKPNPNAQTIATETPAKAKPLSKKERIKENKKNGIACCPKCGSTSLSSNKKGFGVGKAVIGAAVAGPIGLVAGNKGAKKVRVTCLNCGHSWWAN